MKATSINPRAPWSAQLRQHQQATAPKTDRAVEIVKAKFKQVSVYGPRSKRSDSSHESNFTEEQIDTLKAAGFATVHNAGLNVFYVYLTGKGRVASGFKFGWFDTEETAEV